MCILVNIYDSSWGVFFNVTNQSYGKWRSPWGKHEACKSKIIFIIYCLSHFVFQIHLKMLVPYGHPDFVKYGQKETPF